MDASCPAHNTKHISQLSYSIPGATLNLAQLQNGLSNGTALWLGGQCLALYLIHHHPRYKSPPSSSPQPPRAFELGSGIGFTALSLGSLGWDVVATDIPNVITSVLSNNIRNNQHALPPGSRRIHLRELDWLVPPEDWLWQHPTIIASRTPPVSPSPITSSLPSPPYDLICSADTVYDPSLVSPLLRSLHALSVRSAAASPTSCSPPILLCLERRDPALVDHFLDQAARIWNFSLERIPHKKLVRAVQKHNPHWSKEDWEGVELWKLRLITSSRSVDRELACVRK